MTDLWFRPSELIFYKVHVRGPTDWRFLEIRDGQGGFGLAEAAGGVGGRNVPDMVARLADRLRGEVLSSDRAVVDALRVGDASARSDGVLGAAMSSLRAAVADALARRAELPLADYLRAGSGRAGEPSRRVRLYANINRSMLPDDGGDVDRSAESFAAVAARAVAEGFRSVKCAPFDECRAPFDAGGLPPEARKGLERVSAVREAIGAEVELYVDCHSRFDVESAIALEEELRAIGVDWFEEPVDPIGQGDDVLRIRDCAELPLAGAESGYGIETFRSLMESESLDIVMPDVMHCGGPVEAFLTGCELESMKPGCVSLHCPSGPVSLCTSAHATAGFGNVLPLEHAVYEVEWRHEALEPHERIVDGYIELNREPGIGCTLNLGVVLDRGERWTP